VSVRMIMIGVVLQQKLCCACIKTYWHI